MNKKYYMFYSITIYTQLCQWFTILVTTFFVKQMQRQDSSREAATLPPCHLLHRCTPRLGFDSCVASSSGVCRTREATALTSRHDVLLSSLVPRPLIVVSRDCGIARAHLGEPVDDARLDQDLVRLVRRERPAVGRHERARERPLFFVSFRSGGRRANGRRRGGRRAEAARRSARTRTERGRARRRTTTR